uniref:BtHKU5-CoV-2-441 Spike RBD domain n=1 Tax=Bat coronavirus HKU5 TaxID=694008 RepID=UPI003AFB8265
MDAMKRGLCCVLLLCGAVFVSAAKSRGKFIEQPKVQECDFSPLLTGTPPQVYNFNRLSFTNCNYNLTKLLSLFEVSEFSCNAISPSALASTCYSSLTVDYFAFPLSMASYLRPGSTGPTAEFNYRQDFSNPTCRVLATPSSNITITKPSNYNWIRLCRTTGAFGNRDQKVQPGHYSRCRYIAPTGSIYLGGNEGYLVSDGQSASMTERVQMTFVISVTFGTESNSVCPAAAHHHHHHHH